VVDIFINSHKKLASLTNAGILAEKKLNNNTSFSAKHDYIDHYFNTF